MLFDLRGKRKRLVQVSYTLLAAIFLVGFVGLGIGVGNSPGGILDAIGLTGNGSSGSLTSAYDSQIDNANQQLAKNPKDSDALAKLSLNEYLKAKAGITQDPTTGQTSVSSDAHTALGESADAWTKYLRFHKGKPDAGTAAQVVNAYIFLNDASGAARPSRSSPPTSRVRTRTATWPSSNTRRVTSRRATPPPRRPWAWHRSRCASRSPNSSTRSTSRP